MEEKKEHTEVRLRLDPQGQPLGDLGPEPFSAAVEAEERWWETLPEPTEQQKASDREAWMERALRGLKFPPDRRKVRRELEDHFADRLDFLQSQGLSPREAEQAALAALGDPAETGALLRRVHKPWLGWLLGLARAALGLLLLLWVFSSPLVKLQIQTGLQLREHLTNAAPGKPSSVENGNDSIQALRYGQAPEQAELGPFACSLYSAKAFRFRWYDEGELQEFRRTELVLCFQAPPWYSPDLDLLRERLSLEFPDGKRTLEIHRATEGQVFFLSKLGSSFTRSYFYLAWLDQDQPEQVILHYDSPEASCAFHIRFGDWLPGPAAETEGSGPEGEGQP